jgi:hypothetical protein
MSKRNVSQQKESYRYFYGNPTLSHNYIFNIRDFHTGETNFSINFNKTDVSKGRNVGTEVDKTFYLKSGSPPIIV